MNARCPFRFVLAVTLALCAALTAVPTARAQQGDSPEYREAVTTGLQEYERGNYSEARAAFARAHALYPNARTLRGMGLAAFESRNYVAARELLRASLVHGERPLDATQRRDVEAVLARSESNIARVRVALTPASAVLLIDGEPARLEDGSLLLDPGEYSAEARAEGHRTARLGFSAEAGQNKTLEIALVAEHAPSRAGASTGASDGRSGGGASVVPWIVMGGGVALIAGGVVTGLMTNGAEDDLSKSCAAGACDEDARSRGKTLQVATNVLLPAGGVALGAGLLLWYLGQDDAPAGEGAATTPALAFSCGTRGCVALASGAF